MGKVFDNRAKKGRTLEGSAVWRGKSGFKWAQNSCGVIPSSSSVHPSGELQIQRITLLKLHHSRRHQTHGHIFIRSQPRLSRKHLSSWIILTVFPPLWPAWNLIATIKIGSYISTHKPLSKHHSMQLCVQLCVCVCVCVCTCLAGYTCSLSSLAAMGFSSLSAKSLQVCLRSWCVSGNSASWDSPRQPLRHKPRADGQEDGGGQKKKDFNTSMFSHACKQYQSTAVVQTKHDIF